MINQLMGFLSSQRQQIKGWELPLAGLLLTAGLAVSVATVKTTASQHQEQAVNSIAVPSTLETVEPQPQEPAVESPASPSTVTTEPQPQEAGIAPKVVKSPVTVEPLPQDLGIEAPVVPSTVTAQPQLQEPAVEPNVVPPQVTAEAPQPRKSAIKSRAVPPRVRSEIPPSQDLALESPAAAKASIKWNRKAQESLKPNIAQVPNPETSIADGTYLYGQSAQPGELGKEYIVFEARQGKVVGAMYMPSSEYACFYGTLNSKQMNLTVANPYDQSSFSHTIARAQPTQFAAVGGSINIENTYDSLTYPHSVGLDGYQPISQVTDNDKQILSNCLNKYQAQVWNH